MTPQDLMLRIRAIRMLTDGRPHAAAALKWAEHLSHARERQRVAELQRLGFTPREISLGAGNVEVH